LPADAPTAFFSYSRDDSEFALRLAQDLREGGASVWIDQLDIEPGEAWDSAVEDAVTRCQRMVVILSPISVKSTNVRNEIAFALDEKKIIIPILYQDCAIPLQLRRIQHTDFRTDYARSLKILLKTLGVSLQAAATAAAAPAVPEESPSTVLDENERKRAEARALMEQAAEKARRELEQERRQVAEQARLEEERKQAEEQARLEEQRKQREQAEAARLAAVAEAARKRAAEQARLEKEELERKAAAEKARLEQQERERLEQERGGAPVTSPAIASPGLIKIALAVCGTLVVALILYWVMRPKQQATESLSAQAMAERGTDYFNGRGVSQDYQQAASWFRKAAEAGDVRSMYFLGFMYENGWGVEKDRQQAISWYRKAANLGNQNAKDDLKRLGESP
jgi:TPR repeat protein